MERKTKMNYEKEYAELAEQRREMQEDMQKTSCEIAKKSMVANKILLNIAEEKYIELSNKPQTDRNKKMLEKCNRECIKMRAKLEGNDIKLM